MNSACSNAALPALGFPIRESADHRLFSAFPRLIAAVHALLRLLVPRHPPCALNILTVISIGVFRRPRKAGRATPQVPAVAARRRRVPGDTRSCWQLCSFQGPQKAPAGTDARRLTAATCRPGGRSLKTQQHAALRARLEGRQVRSTSLGAVHLRHPHPAHAGEDGRRIGRHDASAPLGGSAAPCPGAP